MVKLLNKLASILVALRYVIKIYKKNSSLNKKNVVYFMFWPNSFTDVLNYIVRGYLVQDVVMLNALMLEGYCVIIMRSRNITTIPSGSNVVYNMTLCTPMYRINKRVAQGESLFNYLSSFQGLNFYPSPLEARLWENKEYMHDQFQYNDIPCPMTWLVRTNGEFDAEGDIRFPVLTKAANSNHSKGIDIHYTKDSLLNAIKSKSLIYSSVLIQDALDISFDIRVVVVNNEIVYHYWRYKSPEICDKFVTTSTSNGSKIDTKELPDNIIKACVNSAYKLNLSLAAFDVTLYNGKVMFFEVSPSFILNPIPKQKRLLGRPYVNYKRRFIQYNMDLIEQFTLIRRLQIKSWKL